MSVALIGWGRFFDSKGNKVTVPAPVDETGKPWLWDFLASQAPALAKVEFDTIQLPPVQQGVRRSGLGRGWLRPLRSARSRRQEPDGQRADALWICGEPTQAVCRRARLGSDGLPGPGAPSVAR